MPAEADPSSNVAVISPDGIVQLGLGFWASKTLLSAVELSLFTELGDGPLDEAALRQRLGLHPRSARDFLDALVALGMLEQHDGRYANTPATDRYLDRNKPSYVGGMLEMANARLYPFWGGLTEALRTGRPQNEAKRKLARGKVLEFFATLPACLVGLEACGAAHYWARGLGRSGTRCG